MRKHHIFLPVALLAAVLTLASCGGGGGSTPATGRAFVSEPGVVAVADVLPGFEVPDRGGDGGGDGGASGGAGDGGALKRATVVLTCSDGVTTKTGPTNDVGAYFIGFNPATCTAPYLVKVIDVGGNTYASVGVETPPAGKVVYINVTPLSDKVVSDILPAGIKGTAATFVPGSLTIANLAAAKTNLVNSIKDALLASGLATTAGFDPIKSTYAFNGTGVDAVLESISASRNAQTGATELRSKLVSVGTDVVPVTTLITAATPLAVAQVNVPASPSLNFSKLDAWMAEINYCLSLGPLDVPASGKCEGSVISNGYLHNSRDFSEDFKTLLSNGTDIFNTYHVPGSTVRNATLLFTGKYPNSLAAYDDLAVVEFTIRQPSVGNVYGAAYASPIEYTKIGVFRRFDGVPGLTAGNWILNGNQRTFDFSIEARYDKFTQANPARSANTAPIGGTSTTTVYRDANNIPVVTATFNVAAPFAVSVAQASGTFTGTATNYGSINQPNYYRSGIRLFFNPSKFDTLTRQYVSANVRAVKVTGPGLPVAGAIMLPNSANICGGDTYMGISTYNAIPTGLTPQFTTTGDNVYTLAAVTDDLINAPYWFAIPNSRRASPAVSDFSSLGAYNGYQAEIQLNDGTIVTESTRILAPVVPPASLAALPWNDPTPSINGQLDAIGIAQPFAQFNVQWVNNPLSAFVEAVSTRTNAFQAAGGTVSGSQYIWDQTKGVFAASSLASRPTSQVTGYPTSATCTGTSGGLFPALQNQADNRSLSLRAYQGRARTYRTVQWAN